MIATAASHRCPTTAYTGAATAYRRPTDPGATNCCTATAAHAGATTAYRCPANPGARANRGSDVDHPDDRDTYPGRFDGRTAAERGAYGGSNLGAASHPATDDGAYQHGGWVE